MMKLKDLTPADLMDEGRRWVIAPVEFMGEREIPNRGGLQESSIQSVGVDLPRIYRRGPGAEMVAVEPFDSGEKSPKSLLWESVMENRIKACAYIQVAARKQAGDALAAFDDDDIGIQTQRERLLGVGERDGYEIIEWYMDEGYSGADPKRPGWNKLLLDAPTAAWTVVLCLHRSRFARLDSIENGMATKILKEAGKKFYSAIEGPLDWDDTACQIIEKQIDFEKRK